MDKIRSIALTVGRPFRSYYPIKTGPEYEKVSGIIDEIHLASAKVSIRHHTENKIWVIPLEDALTKNLEADISFE